MELLRSKRKKSLDLVVSPDEEPISDDESGLKGEMPGGVVDLAVNSTFQIVSLPIELLYMIISYLSTCDKVSLRMVCRSLRSIMDDPNHWRCVVIPPHISAKNPDYVRSVLKHTKSHVQSLSLVGYSSSTSSPYLTSCTSVTALDLYGSRITISAMKQLLLSLPNLSRLSINDGAAQTLLPMLSSLQQLVITMRPLSHKLISCNLERLYLQLAKEELPAKPSNIAIKCIDYASCYFRLMRERFKGYTFGNLSVYEWSTVNMLQTVSTPSFMISKNSVESRWAFHVPGRSDANNKPPIISVSSTAVSSSVFSRSINYTHAFADSLLLPLCPTTSVKNIAALNITSLDLKGITLHSLDNVRNIVEFTPNLLVISVNGIQLSSYDDPLDVLFQALSVYCPKLTSIFALVYSNQHCYHDVENTCELWNNILSLKHLEHLSICSCLFQRSPAPNDRYHLYPNLQLFPISFQSLILHIHQTKHVQVANLDTRVITNICNIQHLRMLHLYIDCFRLQGKIKPFILNLQLLLESCTKLEELLVQPQGTCQIHCSTPVPSISQLKCLKLMNSISVSESFFTDLVPIGQKNMNLQVLHLRVDSLHGSLRHSEMIRIMEHCPSLVSFSCDVLHTRSNAFKAAAMNIGKKHNLLNFHYGSSSTSNHDHRSISSNIEFSVLKIK